MGQNGRLHRSSLRVLKSDWEESADELTREKTGFLWQPILGFPREIHQKPGGRESFGWKEGGWSAAGRAAALSLRPPFSKPQLSLPCACPRTSRLLSPLSSFRIFCVLRKTSVLAVGKSCNLTPAPHPTGDLVSWGPAGLTWHAVDLCLLPFSVGCWTPLQRPPVFSPPSRPSSSQPGFYPTLLLKK